MIMVSGPPVENASLLGLEPSRPVPRIVLGYAADTGEPGTLQTALANKFAQWRSDATAAGSEFWAILGGDNSYSGAAGYAADMAAFETFHANAKLLAVAGNHCGPDLGYTQHLAKFGHLSPAGKPYWTKVLGNGLVQVFGLDWGRRTSDRTFVGPASYAEQRAWLAHEVAASTAYWKIGVIHCPPVTTLYGADRDNADMSVDWPEMAGLDGVLTGHGHATDWLHFRGLPIINASSAVRPLYNGGWIPQGTLGPQAEVVFANYQKRLAARCIVTHRNFLIQMVDTGTGEIAYQADLAGRELERAEWHGEAFGPDEPLRAGYWYTAGHPMRAMAVEEIRVSVSRTGAASRIIEVRANSLLVAALVLPPHTITIAGEFRKMFPPGTTISARIGNPSDLPGAYANLPMGCTVGIAGRWVS